LELIAFVVTFIVLMITLATILIRSLYKKLKRDFGNRPLHDNYLFDDHSYAYLSLTISKNELQTISDRAALKGQSINAYIITATRQRIVRDDNE
jgi:hypothetical protein